MPRADLRSVLNRRRCYKSPGLRQQFPKLPRLGGFNENWTPSTPSGWTMVRSFHEATRGLQFRCYGRAGIMHRARSPSAAVSPPPNPLIEHMIFRPHPRFSGQFQITGTVASPAPLSIHHPSTLALRPSKPSPPPPPSLPRQLFRQFSREVPVQGTSRSSPRNGQGPLRKKPHPKTKQSGPSSTPPFVRHFLEQLIRVRRSV